MVTVIRGLSSLDKVVLEENFLDGTATQRMDLQLDLSKVHIEAVSYESYMLYYLEILEDMSFDWGAIIDNIRLLTSDGKESNNKCFISYREAF